MAVSKENRFLNNCCWATALLCFYFVDLFPFQLWVCDVLEVET